MKHFLTLAFLAARMDGYGIPASGPRPPQRFDDASSESEEEEGICFPAGGGVAESESDKEDQN